MLSVTIPKAYAFCFSFSLFYLLSVRSLACTLRSSWASKMLEAPTSRNGSNARWPCYHCHMARHTASATGSSSPDQGGAASILRLRATSLAELRDSVRSGLPFSALVALTKQLEISPQQFTAVFGIPPRTVARRKEARHLNHQESDRLYRVARSASQAVEVLGSIEKARVWLKTPNRALGREIPLDLLDTEIGARQVEEVLLRLNYGIFS
jgi:putative toxin-antitoxin system antitoxin component (TIGR02293 family)